MCMQVNIELFASNWARLKHEALFLFFLEEVQ